MFRLISKTCESVWKRNAAVSIWLIVSTWLSTSFAYVEYNTGICYVIRANESMPVVGTKFDSFSELIETCRVFVDKSQLIKEIVALKEPIVLITLPRGWGKTINLEMMKMFFEMKVNKDGTPIPKNMTKNYDFFMKGEITPKGRKTMKLRSPPRISTHEEICKKHLSNYLIVHVDMRFSFSPPNLQETFNHVKMLIGETFDKHEYMVKVLRRIIEDENNTKEVRAKAQKDLIIFEKFLMRSETEVGVLVKSLKFLCRILYQHFGKKVIIMIDNYDYAIVDMFAWVFEPFFYDRYEKIEEDVLRFFGKLMKFTLNENQFMEKAILTGRQYICGEYLFADFNTSIAAFDYFDRGLADYYGFTRLESEQIFMKAEVIVEEKNKATNFYYGYRVDKNTPIYMYNPWDIVSFTEEEKLDSYWLQIGGKYWFPHVLKFKSMYEIFKTLYFGFTWLYADFANVHLSRGDLVMLGNLFFEAFQNREYPMTPDDIQLLLKYLCSIGYLTSHGFVYDTVLGRDALRVKIPNEEVRNEYKNFTFELKPPYTWAEPE